MTHAQSGRTSLPQTTSLASIVLNVNRPTPHQSTHRQHLPHSHSLPHKYTSTPTPHVHRVPQSVTTTTDDEQPANAQISPSPPEHHSHLRGGGGGGDGSHLQGPVLMNNALSFSTSYSDSKSRSHRSQTMSPKSPKQRVFRSNHKTNRSNTTLDIPDIDLSRRNSPSQHSLDEEEEDMDEEAFDRILLSCSSLTCPLSHCLVIAYKLYHILSGESTEYFTIKSTEYFNFKFHLISIRLISVHSLLTPISCFFPY